MRTSAYNFSLNRADFDPQQLDLLNRTFERAWSAYILEHPVLNEERAKLREQLAKVLFDTAKLYFDPNQTDEQMIEKLKGLTLSRFLALSRFSNKRRSARRRDYSSRFRAG